MEAVISTRPWTTWSVGQLSIEAVTGLVAETGSVTEAVILALNPAGKLLTEAVTGLVADTGSVIDAVMLAFPGNVVGKLAIEAVTGLVADTGSVMVPVIWTLCPGTVTVPVTQTGAPTVIPCWLVWLTATVPDTVTFPVIGRTPVSPA
jgi:hypothetical protein